MSVNRTAEIAAARAADEQIAAEWDKFWKAVGSTVVPAQSALADAEKALRNGRYYYANDAAEIAKREARVEARRADLEKAQAEVRPLAAAARALDAELYTGWTRFYLVQHIHSSQHCSSFRDNTQIGWLPNLSGQTEAEAVAEHGAILCTKCFPSAPVEMTDGRGVPVTDGTCPGSGQRFDPEQPNTAHYHFGPMATCPSCGELVGLKSRGSNMVRKHKRP